MKKILLVLMAVLIVTSMFGCSTRSAAEVLKKVTEPTVVPEAPAAATADEASSDEASLYPDTLEGLCKYLADCGFAYEIQAASTDKNGKKVEADPIVMDAKLIGADKGYKFRYTFDGNKVALEVYSYSDFEGKFYQQIKTSGEVTIYDKDGKPVDTVDATLSANGKYVLIYNDASGNKERKETLEKVFLGFYA